MIYAHCVATIFLGVMWMLTSGIVAILGYGLENVNILNVMFIWPVALVLGIPVIVFAAFFATPLTLPYGVIMHILLQKLGYTNWGDYVLAGFVAGVALGLLTSDAVDPALEVDSDYIEQFGWDRAKLYLGHYIKGGTAGIIFAISYWSVANKKPFWPTGRKLTEQSPSRLG